MLLAEHNIQFFLEVGLTVLALVVPWAIYIERKLTKLDTKLNNGLCKQIELMRLEIVSQREEFGKRIHDLEIAQAKIEGGKSGIHEGT